MKRIAIIAALPALLIVVWIASQSSNESPAATIEVETTDVRGTRNTLVDKLAATGASVRSEASAGADAKSTSLVFELPVAQLENALAIVHANATVLDKQVDLEAAFSDVKSVESGLGTLDSCLNRAVNNVESNSTASAQSSIAECRAQLDRTLARVSANPNLAEPVQLELTVSKRGTTNYVLIIVTVTLLGVLGVAAVQMVRAMRSESVVDIRNKRSMHDDLFDRRN